MHFLVWTSRISLWIPCGIGVESRKGTVPVGVTLPSRARENLVRKAILQGMDPQQAYLQYGKF